MTDELAVEFIAMLLLAPLIWSSAHPPSREARGEAITVIAATTMRPHVDASDGRIEIHPPQDRRLTMTVLEHAVGVETVRGPASVVSSGATTKIIEVIVSAP